MSRMNQLFQDTVEERAKELEAEGYDFESAWDRAIAEIGGQKDD